MSGTDPREGLARSQTASEASRGLAENPAHRALVGGRSRLMPFLGTEWDGQAF